MKKVHGAHWEEDECEIIPDSIELWCGMNIDKLDDVAITTNLSKVTCTRCLKRRKK